MACVVHVGPYEGLAAAVQVLPGWLEANGWQPAGPLREVYLRFGADPLPFALPPAYLTARSDEFVTELQQPVERT